MSLTVAPVSLPFSRCQVREHAAAVLLSFSRIADLQAQLCVPDSVKALISTLTPKEDEDKDFAHTLRRYAGTILADLSMVPEMQECRLQGIDLSSNPSIYPCFLARFPVHLSYKPILVMCKCMPELVIGLSHTPIN